MIGFLRGTAVRHDIVDAGNAGVGYVVLTAHPLQRGEPVELWVSTVVREDAITLYGFETEAEQAVFEVVIGVPRVGAKTALALLRDLGAPAIVAAVVAKDGKALAAARGVGPKVGDSIVAAATFSDELLASVDATFDVDTPVPAAVELKATLCSLGYNEADADAAARHAVDSTGSTDDGELLTAALAHIRGVAA